MMRFFKKQDRRPPPDTEHLLPLTYEIEDQFYIVSHNVTFEDLDIKGLLNHYNHYYDVEEIKDYAIELADEYLQNHDIKLRYLRYNVAYHRNVIILVYAVLSKHEAMMMKMFGDCEVISKDWPNNLSDEDKYIKFEEYVTRKAHES